MTDIFQLEVKPVNAAELRRMDVVDSFDIWSKSKDSSGKAALRNGLVFAASTGREVWVASKASLLLGFSILSNFDELPKTVIIEILEVARAFRDNGIGTQLMRRILEKHSQEILVIELAPEANHEEDLVRFYKKFGFKHVSRDVMILNPYHIEKLKEWVHNLVEFIEIVDSSVDNKRNPPDYPFKIGVTT